MRIEKRSFATLPGKEWDGPRTAGTSWFAARQCDACVADEVVAEAGRRAAQAARAAKLDALTRRVVSLKHPWKFLDALSLRMGWPIGKRVRRSRDLVVQRAVDAFAESSTFLDEWETQERQLEEKKAARPRREAFVLPRSLDPVHSYPADVQKRLPRLRHAPVLAASYLTSSGMPSLAQIGKCPLLPLTLTGRLRLACAGRPTMFSLSSRTLLTRRLRPSTPPAALPSLSKAEVRAVLPDAVFGDECSMDYDKMERERESRAHRAMREAVRLTASASGLRYYDGNVGRRSVRGALADGLLSDGRSFAFVEVCSPSMLRDAASYHPYTEGAKGCATCRLRETEFDRRPEVVWRDQDGRRVSSKDRRPRPVHTDRLAAKRRLTPIVFVASMPENTLLSLLFPPRGALPFLPSDSVLLMNVGDPWQDDAVLPKVRMQVSSAVWARYVRMVASRRERAWKRLLREVALYAKEKRALKSLSDAEAFFKRWKYSPSRHRIPTSWFDLDAFDGWSNQHGVEPWDVQEDAWSEDDSDRFDGFDPRLLGPAPRRPASGDVDEDEDDDCFDPRALCRKCHRVLGKGQCYCTNSNDLVPAPKGDPWGLAPPDAPA